MIAAPRDELRMPALHLQEAPGSDDQHPRHLQAEERSGALRGPLPRAGKFEETRVRASLPSRFSTTSGCGDGSSAETHPTAQPRGAAARAQTQRVTPGRAQAPTKGKERATEPQQSLPRGGSSANFARRGCEGAPTSARCYRTELRAPPPPPLLRAAAAARAAVGEAAGGRTGSPRRAPSAAAGVCGRMRARGPCKQPRSGAICGPSGGGATGRAGR